jgi:carboxypeptidase Q
MRRLITSACFLLILSSPLAAQFGQARGFTVDDPVLHRLWTLGMDSSSAEAFGQVLFDSLGPRLTASPGMTAAQDWLVQTYTRMGISVRKEQYGTWRSWRRGRTHVDLVAPRARSLEATMLSWSPGTGNRPVRGDVIVLPDVADSNALVQWLPQARGKFVLVSFAQPTCRPDTSWAAHTSHENYDRMRAQRDTASRAWTQRIAHTGYPGGRNGIANLSRRLEQGGVAGVLTSTWAQGWGVDRIFETWDERAPVLDVSCEDYGLLYRLASHNQGPVIEATADAQPLGEVPVFNVVAVIPGTQVPNEYVMLSAHFDSWDGASGATDNGTGTITMLEAMRLLKLAYPNPRRTILVGHWSAEEQGLVGSHAWVADHADIVNGLQALFNQDNGTGRVTALSASGFINAGADLARWMSRLPAELTNGVTLSAPGSPGGGGTDHSSFVCIGAPGFGLFSEFADYFSYTWHTTRDTYDKIMWDDVRNNATLTAMLVYLASEDPGRVSRDRRTVLQPGQNGQPGTWPTCDEPPRATRRP